MKKLITMLLCGIIISSSIPIYSFAADTSVAVEPVEPTIAIKEKDPAGRALEPATSGLEAAILAVKEKITIPEDYSEFNYYFYDSGSYSGSSWSLNWRNPNLEAVIQVNCDENYHITNFYQYNYTNKTAGVAKYLKSELKATADAFINQIVPETKNKLELIDVTYEGVYSGNYVYNYKRRNNGVEFPDNTVTVGVSSISGEVTYASVNWIYDVTVPSSKVKVTKEEATALIKENMQMKLTYRSNYIGIYDKNGTESTKAYLVYEPTLNYISIDAKTGEVYLNRSEWVDTGNYNYKEASEATKDNAGGLGFQVLTEEEIAKIEELKKLISKEKAIDIVTGNSYLYLEDTLKAYSASLSKVDGANGKTQYVWNVTLSDPREIDYSKNTDYYRAYANASVDASTGKILSFNSSMKGYYNEKTQSYEKVNVVYNKEESRAILEKFLKSQIKNRFNNSVLSNEYEGYVACYKEGIPVYGGYSYQYNRVNEKVEYPNNYINGSVDGVTGKIYSFYSYWDDSVVFESTEGAMSADKAMDCYLGKDGYGLKYEINVINKYDSNYKSLDSYYDYNEAYSVDYEIRLVYRPDIVPALISPFSGDKLNYDGEVYKEIKPYSYLDIANTPENRNILLLADMNIGFQGENFLPNQAITVGEINMILQNVGYGYGYSEQDDTKADNPITKEELAQVFVKQLGLEKLAKLTGIYTTGYADEKDINKDYFGAVALMKGFEIMTGDKDNNFKAKSNITRFDAIALIMNFIAAQQKGIYY